MYMKLEFFEAEIEFIKLENSDIIVTSDTEKIEDENYLGDV